MYEYFKSTYLNILSIMNQIKWTIIFWI